MPFQPGHKINEGKINNPDGRKSMYEERQDANFIADVWEFDQDIEALERKVIGKKYSGREITALKLLKGDARLMAKFMDKLVPDLVDVRSKGEQIGTNLTEEQKAVLNSLLKNESTGA